MSDWNQKIIAEFRANSGRVGGPLDLLARPRAVIEVGTDTVDVVARVTKDEERDAIWSAHKADYQGFADYERKTAREIPVIFLRRAA
jgi:hypothetical protein